jgi:hypothetical protein
VVAVSLPQNPKTPVEYLKIFIRKMTLSRLRTILLNTFSASVPVAVLTVVVIAVFTFQTAATNIISESIHTSFSDGCGVLFHKVVVVTHRFAFKAIQFLEYRFPDFEPFFSLRARALSGICNLLELFLVFVQKIRYSFEIDVNCGAHLFIASF